MSVSRSIARAADPRPHAIARAAAALLALGGAVVALSLAAPAAGAQTAARPAMPSASITPYAGYLVTGNFFEGPVGTTLSSAGGPMYGAQLAIPLVPSLSVVGNVGYSKGDLRVGIPFVGGLSVGEVETLVFDAGLELRSPTGFGASGAIVPFVQAGVGGVRHDVDVSVLQTRATGTAFNYGLGADLAFGRNVGVRLLARDYVGKFDFKEATGFDIEGKTAHNWALTAGLTLSF